VASENEKTVFGLPGLPLESTEAPPEDKPAAAGERTLVGLSFGADELAQLDAAIASVEERATGPSEAAAKSPTQRSAPLPPPRPRGSTAAAPVIPAPAESIEPPANATVLMNFADFGDLDKLLSGEVDAAPAPAAAVEPEPARSAQAAPDPELPAAPGATESSRPAESNATMLFDPDELGDALSSVFGQATSSLSAAGVEAELEQSSEPDALSSVFGQATSSLSAAGVEAELEQSSEPDEVDAAFAATGGISAADRTAALAALEEEQQASARADVKVSNAFSAPAPTPIAAAEPAPAAAPVAPPATAAGTLLMSSEWLEQAAAAAVAAAKPAEPKVAPPRAAPAPAPAPTPASNATLYMGPESVVPDSSSTRTAYSAADLSDAKTELPAPEKTKRYQTGAVPRVESHPAQRESQRREAPLAAPARSESREPAPVRRDTAALWVAGIATVLVLAAVAWYFLH
jgi:hypothetical protein